MFSQHETSRLLLPSLIFILSFLIFIHSNNADSATPQQRDLAAMLDSSSFHEFVNTKYDKIFNQYPQYTSAAFDFPVGKPDARNYFKAREFGESKHLGEDWNGVGGGNSDLGDPVYSVSNGYVSFAKNVCCGWGNIIRVVHHTPNHPEYKYVESFYAHLDEIHVKPGDLITRGQLIGTIGNANGVYSAHLHLEMRHFVDMGVGPGYSDDTFGFLVPTDFINQN